MSQPADQELGLLNTDYEKKYGFKDAIVPVFQTAPGLSEDVIRSISEHKKEPQWMLDLRLKAYKVFLSKPMPEWGADLGKIDFDKIIYYLSSSNKTSKSWDDVPEKIKKTFERLGIPEAEQKFLGGVGAQYECLDENSLVYTQFRGPVKIKNIKKGDVVFSFDEMKNKIVPSTVNAVSRKGVRSVYTMRLGSRNICATKNHPFLCLVHHKHLGKRRGRYVHEWKYLHELHVGDLVAVIKKVPFKGVRYKLSGSPRNVRDQPVHLPRITSEDLMWFLGVYVGDGCIHREQGKRKARIEIAIPYFDTALQEELRCVVKKLFCVDMTDPDTWRLALNSTRVSEWLVHNGFGGKAKTKQIPRWIFSLPRRHILSFLGGYVDADGYVRDSKKNHDVSITSANKSLLEATMQLCAYCGITSSRVIEFKSKHPFDPKRMMQGYRLQLSGAFDQILCRSEARLDRMLKRKFVHDGSSTRNSSFRKHITDELGFVRIDELAPAETAVVYDLEIAGTHNFVSEGILVHNSDTVYHKLREDLEKKGVVFTDTDSALKTHEDLLKQWFGKVVPAGDNKFAALNTAVWSGGSFIYIPPGVHVDVPLQAYFRINAQNMGQFERTMIIVDKGASVHYIEGCTSPIYSSESLHSAVVEVVALPGAKVRYTTIQNWSGDVYNLVTKRAFAYEHATVEWIDGNLGSKITMKYPSVYLLGKGARADILSVAYAGRGQHQDAGGKAVHLAPQTQSRIVSKSVAKDGGRTSYRGFLKVAKNCPGSISNVRCDALLLDPQSRSDTYPAMKIDEKDVTIGHEATVGRVGEEQLFYLRSRGLTESEALAMIVLGFIAEFTKQLPMEYAIELNKLIQLDMEGSIG